ncbi:uncharacterized protein LOC129581205 [Paramacrobiotus metropolitanus]|uniref:uncharacterized protein LOC129581205 n=1 Tax=Paramacrobiotus metropolitanus TaxID=2943436 RepID=UPI002445B791|nr:uncharacterized protein LOC129581205 [Paramacrobiotus metropolitanus]
MEAGKIAVQVLFRARPDHPWKWYPGALLMYFVYNNCLSDYAWVDVMVEGCSVRELFPKRQIRLPLTDRALHERRLEHGSFLIRTCSVPDAQPYGDLSTTEPAVMAAFCNLLERQFHLKVVSADNRAIVYLQHHRVSRRYLILLQ